VAVETRFARIPSGPVPYRVDGSGTRQLLILSDWGQPYGEPGGAAYEAFARQLAGHDAQAVMLLDGTVGGAKKRTDVERRLAGARAAAEATNLDQATLLGASDGAPAAAMLAAQEPAGFSRLILYDTFAPETRKAWAMSPAEDFGAAMAELEQLGPELKTASVAWDWARELWKSKDKGKKEGPRPPIPPIPSASDSSVPLSPFSPQWKDGLAQLMERVANLETRTPHANASLGAIAMPTVVLEVRADGAGSDARGSLGLQIASQIPGATHRVVSGRSRWPWGEPNAMADVLALPGGREAFPVTGGDAPPTAPAAEADRVLATILFTDIVGSTERLAELGDSAWRELLVRHHDAVRGQLARFAGREIDTAGDGFLAAFDAPARAVRCAVAIRDEVRDIGLSVRCGLHTGECERVGDKLVGIAVHIGARIAGEASADEVLVSSTVRDLVAGAGITFTERGAATLKGLPGEWLLFAVSRID